MNVIVDGVISKEPPLRAQMLTGANRALVIAAKAIFQKAIIEYAKKVIEPTYENCSKPLALRLLKARDLFFRRYPNPYRKEMIESAWKILIEEVEHNDEYYPYWNEMERIIKEF